MNKKRLMSAIMALAMPIALLTSCQSDESVTDDRAGGRKVAMSVDVSYPGCTDTRTNLEENEGDMIGSWAEGDRLLISDTDGKNLGTLDLVSGAGTKQATFQGNLTTDVADGTYTFTFTYIGSGNNPTQVSDTKYPLDIATQEGKADGLNRYDVFSGQAEYKVINDASYAEELLTFTKRLALAHFELIFPDGVSMTNGDVVISGTNLKSSAAIDLTNGKLTDITDGNITVTGTNGDFYITMIPADNVTPTFSVSIDGVDYEGTLAERSWNAGEFVRQGDKVGVPVEMKKVSVKPTIDGSVLGHMWAPANNRSWIDATPSNDDAYLITYIPTVSFTEQDIQLAYSQETMFSDTDNPYAYHYQWGRDFGFIASNYAYDESNVYLPNASNIPSSWRLQYYDQQMSRSSLANANNFFEVFYTPTGTNDWCSTTRTIWAPSLDANGGVAFPAGYHIPTLTEWNTLLPEGENKVYTYSSTGYSIDGGTAYPFYVKNESDGSTVIWSMWQTSTKKYLDVRRVAGTYSLNEVNAEVLACDYPLQLPADGYRSGTGLQQWQERGLYWASDSQSSTKGTAYCFSFTINTNARTITLATGPQFRKFGFSIRCIKD